MENSSAYFPLLDQVASGAFDSAESDQDLYNRFLGVLDEDGHLSTPEALSLFKWGLSMRIAAPRIEAHYQYYETGLDAAADIPCDTWVAVGSDRYCSEDLSDGFQETE